MKFRDEQVDDVKIVDSNNKEVLIKKIKAIGKKNIIVDIQYATSTIFYYSVLILTRKREEQESV